jgi:hypothetical protein
MENKWISVKDNLPDNLVDVLIYDPFQNESIVGWYDERNKKWVSGLSAPEDYFEIHPDVTHWMHLPEPPKQ